MLTGFPLQLIVGSLLGFLASLGVGGGSLLMLWLTIVLGLDPQTARGINLLFFLPCALTAVWIRKKQIDLPFQKIIPAIVSGCAGAVLFSWLGCIFQFAFFRKMLGILFLITGIKELCYRPRKFR